MGVFVTVFPRTTNVSKTGEILACRIDKQNGDACSGYRRYDEGRTSLWTGSRGR